MDGLCAIGWDVFGGEGVECCFLLGQSAVFHVVLTDFGEHKRVTLDINENLGAFKGTKLQANHLHNVYSNSFVVDYCR